MMMPVHLRSRPGLSFPCPNPHCHSHQEATEAHLLQYRVIGLDSTFYDLLIAILAGLISWHIDMSDSWNYACPFSGMGAISERRILRSSRNIYWNTQRPSHVTREPWMYFGGQLSSTTLRARNGQVLGHSEQVITARVAPDISDWLRRSNQIQVL
jgi:hypothetical protein